MINLWERMEKIGNTQLWIEGAWAPKLQRVNEEPVMERIVKLKGITKGELKQVNTMRLCMRVVTVADMANKAGTDIMDNMMYGKRRTGTALTWPREYYPGRKYW
jgi:hypothetical protein